MKNSKESKEHDVDVLLRAICSSSRPLDCQDLYGLCEIKSRFSSAHRVSQEASKLWQRHLVDRVRTDKKGVRALYGYIKKAKGDNDCIESPNGDERPPVEPQTKNDELEIRVPETVGRIVVRMGDKMIEIYTCPITARITCTTYY